MATLINATDTGIVPGGAQVYTFPANTDTLVGRASTDTLTNKTLVAPVLGAATATTINKITITQPATGSTLTLVDGSSLVTSGAFAITLTSTATTNVTLPTTGTLATLAGSESLTNKSVNGVTLTTGGSTSNYLGADGTYHALGSGGTVTSVSVVSANGFAGTVATSTSTPAITISTSITGVIKGNGTAISAATAGTDYSVGTSALTTGILKSTTTTGALTIAVAADFPTLNQNTTGNAATVTTNANLTGDVTSVGNATTLTNAPVIAKVLTGYTSGAGTISSTDSILSAIQKLNGNDGLKAPLASPTFTGTVTLPAGQVVNGVTLSTGSGATEFLNGAGNYVLGLLNINNMVWFQDQKTSGTAAQSLTGGTTNQRNLITTIINNISGVSLSSNQITGLPAGTYYASGFGATNGGSGSGQSRLWLYNITDSANVSNTYGPSLNNINASGFVSYFSGYFTISGTKTIELRHYVGTSCTGGVPSSIASVPEIYAEIQLWKVA